MIRLNKPVMQRPGNQVPAVIVDNNSGVFRIPGVYDHFEVPRTSIVTLTSASASGSEDKTFYLFHEDVFNATPTNNGSGASSITVTYDDGFSAKWLNRVLTEANGGRGLLCKGFSLQYTVTSGGAADPTGLAAAAIQLRTYNGKNGGYKPYNIDVAEAIRNTQQNTGLVTIETSFWMNGFTQFTGNLPDGDTVQITFMWDLKGMGLI